MRSVIIDWNPDLPLVASQAFEVGGRSFRDGDPFPWREIGVDEQTAYNMWRASLVSHPAGVIDAAAEATLPGFVPGGSFDIEATGPASYPLPADATPAATIIVNPPKPKRQRSQRAE